MLPLIGFLGILLGIIFIVVGITTEEAKPTPPPPPPAPIKPKTERSKVETKKIEAVKAEEKLPAPGYIYCPYCGEQIPKGSKFCPNCGAALD
ncbi:MAG: zinc ribbon domain-containing protein [Candidatus Jordarchaeales archaeon]